MRCHETLLVTYERVVDVDLQLQLIVYSDMFSLYIEEETIFELTAKRFGDTNSKTKCSMFKK